MAEVRKKDNTVLWWVGWITLTIVSFFISCYFWTPLVAKYFGDMQKPGAPAVWMTAVFGTWMLLLVPLIIVMYSKVDKAYEDARMARETKAFEKAKSEFKIRSIAIDASQRRLPEAIVQKIKTLPEAIKKGHLVTAKLRDGRAIPHVFVLNKKEVLGVYDQTEWVFQATDIVDVEPSDLDRLPDFKSEKWLRLDGAGME